MKKGRFKKCIALIVAAAMIMPAAIPAYADSAESEVEQVSDIGEYIDATDAADYDDPAFGTCRIKVKAELDSLEGALEGVIYDGSTLLRYERPAAAKAAYYRLVKKYGDRNVIVDMPIMKAESAAKSMGWGTDFMNLDDESVRRVKTQKGKAVDVTVAVIDSGITQSHEIFKGQTISSKSRSLLSESDTISDEDGHGTSVAGIIAESTPSNVELMILKTYTDGNKISIETVNQAIVYAVDNGADIINLSMATAVEGVPEQYSDLVNKSVAEMEEQLAYAESKGVIICASSGNDGGDMDALGTYPACSSHTISVGSVDNSGKWSFFSNYGSKLDFCAPGQELIVAAYNTSSQYYIAALNPDNCSGTSFAAPYISACCSFVKMDNPKADNEYAKQKLKAAAVDYGDPGWDKYYGWGMPKYKEFDEAAYEAALAEARAKSITSVTINTKTVTAKKLKALIASKGGKPKYIKKVILGSKVKTIGQNTFKGTNALTVVVKTKSLTKKSVKGSLKGSRVKTIQVSVSKKVKINKQYVKKYKKIFTKKNAGRKVTVKR